MPFLNVRFQHSCKKRHELLRSILYRDEFFKKKSAKKAEMKKKSHAVYFKFRITFDLFPGRRTGSFGEIFVTFLKRASGEESSESRSMTSIVAVGFGFGVGFSFGVFFSDFIFFFSDFISGVFLMDWAAFLALGVTVLGILLRLKKFRIHLRR